MTMAQANTALEVKNRGDALVQSVKSGHEVCRTLWNALQPVVRFAQHLESFPAVDVENLPENLTMYALASLFDGILSFLRRCNDDNSKLEDEEMIRLMRSVRKAEIDIHRLVTTRTLASLHQQHELFGEVVDALFVSSGEDKKVDCLVPSGTYGNIVMKINTDLKRRAPPYCCDKFAIKIIDTAVAESEGCNSDRLQRDIETISQLRHPAIAQHYISYLSDNSRYLNIVMEAVEGTHLSDIILPPVNAPAATYTEHTAAVWVGQVAAGIAHLHAHSILHGDLRAANVVITRDQSVKIVGLDLARRGSPVGATAGSPASPWRPTGERVDDVTFDGRDDVRALGIVLYELLTHTLVQHNGSAVKSGKLLRAARSASPVLGGEVLPLLLESKRTRRPTAAQVKRLLDAYVVGPKAYQRARDTLLDKLGQRGLADKLRSWQGCGKVVLYIGVLIVALLAVAPTSVPAVTLLALACSVRMPGDGAYFGDSYLSKGTLCRAVRTERDNLVGFANIAALSWGSVRDAASTALIASATADRVKPLTHIEYAALMRLLSSKSYNTWIDATETLQLLLPSHCDANSEVNCAAVVNAHARIITAKNPSTTARSLIALARIVLRSEEAGRHVARSGLLRSLAEVLRPADHFNVTVASAMEMVHALIADVGSKQVVDVGALHCLWEGPHTATQQSVETAGRVGWLGRLLSQCVLQRVPEPLSVFTARNIVEGGLLPVVGQVLRDMRGKRGAMHAAGVLSALTRMGQWVDRVLAEPGMVTALVAQLTAGTDEGKRYAAQALCNIAKHSQDAQRAIAAAGATQPLSDLALSNDEGTRVAANSALAALKVHWEELLKGEEVSGSR